MIYLEYTQEAAPVPGHQPSFEHHAVELNVKTIAEAAQLFLAYEVGFGPGRKLELTSIGTSKKRGVEYGRWGSL